MSLLVAMAAACSSAPPESATGPELYSELCSTCHGTELEGKVGPPLGPGAASASLPDAYIANAITHGTGTMPSFNHLSSDQILKLVAFIRDVQAGG